MSKSSSSSYVAVGSALLVLAMTQRSPRALSYALYAGAILLFAIPVVQGLRRPDSKA